MKKCWQGTSGIVDQVTKNLEGSRFFSLLGGVRHCLSGTQDCNGPLAHSEDYKVKIGPINSMKTYRTSRGFAPLIYKLYIGWR
jgi:hypothetical protein